VAVTAAAVSADFTAIGHVLALLLGMGLSFRLPMIAYWTLLRMLLLLVGSAFGYFVMSGSSVAATAGGLAGALIAVVAGLRRARRVSRTAP
jgi:hypothetical protein